MCVCPHTALCKFECVLRFFNFFIIKFYFISLCAYPIFYHLVDNKGTLYKFISVFQPSIINSIINLPCINLNVSTPFLFSYYNLHVWFVWRSRDELIRDVLLWTPTHGRAKAGQPARIYIQQLCEDTGCCPEDLRRAMNDREEWRERVRDIRATSATWWWWWLWTCIM